MVNTCYSWLLMVNNCELMVNNGLLMVNNG
jgi:hypothetical protein